MNASSDDARLMFDRWREDSSQVRIKLLSPYLVFHGTGRVLAFNAGSLKLGGESWNFTIPLDDVEYSFSDPREIPVATIREIESAKYEMGLALRMASGDELVLMELKTPEV